MDGGHGATGATHGPRIPQDLRLLRHRGSVGPQGIRPGRLTVSPGTGGPAGIIGTPGRPALEPEPLDDPQPNSTASPTSEPAPEPDAAGLRDQLGRTRAAAKRLLAAHRDLAGAELGDILDEVKAVSILAGVAIAAVLLAGLIVPVGLSLFIGEWLFGSIGWGVLHGPLFLVGLAAACVMAALGVRGSAIVGNLLIAIVIGVVVGLVLGLDLSNQGWARLGEAVFPGVEAGARPLATAVIVGAVVIGLLGLLLGLRSGGGSGALGGLVGGAIGGVVLGAFTAIAFGPRVGAAVGVTVALIAWPALMGAMIARRGVDTDALKARFYPSETIETTKETIEWVRNRAPLGRRS
ncbi:MAG TPA: hypothetical protein VH720_03235 [Candidatus Limnocylindrales bacterium]